MSFFNLKRDTTNEKTFSRKLLKEYNKGRPLKYKNIFCLAPFVSLQFNNNGKVIPCCFNRAIIYGRYPENSIHDIWFSEEVRSLRKSLSNNDLSDGCIFCEYNLINRNFNLIQSKDYDQYGIDEKNGYPSMFGFSLDNTCNLKCQMCTGEFSSTYRSEIENRPPYSNPYDSSFISQLEEFIPHLKRVILSGGEPFLNKLYFEMIERIIAINPKIEIIVCTNGTVLNDRIKDLMNRGIFYFSISIDSFNKAVFESIRQKANFEEVISNFNYYYDYSQQHNRWITASVCPLQQNWREIPDIIRRMNGRGINVFINNVYFPHFSTLRTLNHFQLTEIINLYSEQKFEVSKGDYISEQNVRMFNDLIKLLKIWRKEGNAQKEPIPISEISEMKKEFIKYLEEIILRKNNLSAIEKNEKIIQYTATLESIFIAFEGKDDLLAKAIYNISKLPNGIFYAELEISDLERLIGRFNQSGI